MKKIYLLALLLASCSGFYGTEKGYFSGRLTDVSEEGIFFTSCEMSFVFGEQGSRTSECSIKGGCGLWEEQVGEVVKVKYRNRLFDQTIASAYECEVAE